MFSSAVSTGTRLKAWKTKPSRSRRSRVRPASSSLESSSPSSTTEPEVGLSSPASRCMSVDLPEPDGPMIAVNWPAGNEIDDAAERVHRGLPLTVGAVEVGRGRDRGRGGGGELMGTSWYHGAPRRGWLTGHHGYGLPYRAERSFSG